MFERFTDRARKVMALANQEAQRFNHEYIGTEHILLGIVKEGSGVGANVLKNLDIDLRRVRNEVEKLVKPGVEMVVMGKLPQTPAAKKVIEYAIIEARDLNHNYVGTEHLLLGLTRDTNTTACEALAKFGVTADLLRKETLNLLGSNKDDEPTRAGGDGGRVGHLLSPAAGDPPRVKTPALDAFGVDLSALAASSQLDEVVPRDEYIERIIQDLSRRTRHNSVLVGDPGVGKTSIIHGLAHRLHQKRKVPKALHNVRLVRLDVTLMIAGTKYRGQAEERIRAVINEAKRTGNVILFISDMQILWNHPEITSSVAVALGLGELRIVGLASREWYNQVSMDGDQILARSISPIFVEEPSEELTLRILSVAVRSLEKHHGVAITKEAVKAAAELGSMFRPGVRQPANALEVVDQACVQVSQSADDSEETAATLQTKAGRDPVMQAPPSSEHHAPESISREPESTRTHAGVCAVDVDEVVAAVAALTGLDCDKIRSRNADGVSPGTRASSSQLPAFERLQTESILQGDGIEIHRGLGFVLLPHTQEFEDIYNQAIAPAMDANKISALKANEIHHPGAILNQVWNQIRHAEIIVADVSQSNLNVIFELGLCFGIRRFPILLVRDPDELPFNLRNLRHIEYKNTVGGIVKLRKDLQSAIAAFAAEVRKPSTPTRELGAPGARSRVLPADMQSGRPIVVDTVNPALPLEGVIRPRRMFGEST
ncbi:MAG TPA: Clp protease N-terminal domain-containing protein [Phycisphaerales bacterium]